MRTAAKALLVPAVLAVLLTSTACTPNAEHGTDLSDSQSSDSQSSTRAPETPHHSPDPGTAPGVTQHHDLTDEHPIEWSDAEVIDGDSIRVHFAMGTPSCFGIRADIDETPDEVRIAIFHGTLPDALEACTADAVLTHTTLHLENPLGDREITALPH